MLGEFPMEPPVNYHLRKQNRLREIAILDSIPSKLPSQTRKSLKLYSTVEEYGMIPNLHSDKNITIGGAEASRRPLSSHHNISAVMLFNRLVDDLESAAVNEGIQEGEDSLIPYLSDNKTSALEGAQASHHSSSSIDKMSVKALTKRRVNASASAAGNQGVDNEEDGLIPSISVDKNIAFEDAHENCHSLSLIDKASVDAFTKKWVDASASTTGNQDIPSSRSAYNRSIGASILAAEGKAGPDHHRLLGSSQAADAYAFLASLLSSLGVN